MWSITLKLMKKSGRMLIPAGIAILIGTAFIAATFLFGNSMNDALGNQLTAQFAQANYIIDQPDDASGTGEGGNDAKPLSVADFKLDSVKDIAGVRAVSPVLQIAASVSHGAKRNALIGVITSNDRKLLPVAITHGTQPIGPRQVALSEGVARDLNVSIGQRVKVSFDQTDGRAGSGSDVPQALTVQVVGLTHDTYGVYGASDGAAVVSDDVVAAANGVSDINQIPLNESTVLLDVDESQAGTAIPAVRTLIPKGYAIQSKKAAADEAIRGISAGSTSVVTMFLMIFGVLAMLVAALVIANTFQVMVAQRRRTLALLRAIGAKKGQLYRSVLMEAGMLGLVASALGVLAGIALMALFSAFGASIGDAGSTMHVRISAPVIWVPTVFGVVITMLASISSARSATSVTPLEALRPFEVSQNRKAGRLRAVAGVLMLVVGLVLCVFGASKVPGVSATAGVVNSSDADVYNVAMTAAIGGCVLVFLGLVITAVFWLPVAMRGVGVLVSHLGPSARIAHANIQKNPRRIAATGVALLIGVTLVSTIATGAASGKETMGNVIDAHYSVDMGAQGEGLNSKAAEQFAKVRGVKTTLYAPIAFADAKDAAGNDLNITLVGVDSVQALQSVMRPSLRGVSLDDNTVLLPKVSPTDQKNLKLSNTIDLKADAASNNAAGHSLTLEAQQADYRQVSANGMVGFVNVDHFRNGDLKTSGHLLYGRLGSDMSVFKRLQDVAAANGHISIFGPAAERDEWNKMIDRIMLLIVGLLAIAVIIALIGVANTLSLSVIERTRESATLRAIGMTRGQLKRSLAIEALLISVVSGVLGIAVGTGFGWLGSFMVFDVYGKVTYPFDWRTAGIVLLVAAIAALLASVLPARRAVRTSPVEALAEA